MNSNHIIFEESESMEVSSKDPSIRDHDLPNVDRLALNNYQNYQLLLAAQETSKGPKKTRISPTTHKHGTPITHGSISTIEIERDSDHPKVSESSVGRDTKSNIGLKTPRSPEQDFYRDFNDSDEIGRIQDEFDQLDMRKGENESLGDLGPFDTAQIEKDTEGVPEYMMISDTYRKVGIDDVDYMKLDEEVEDFKRIMEKSDRCVQDIKMRIEKSPIVQKRKLKDSDCGSDRELSFDGLSARKRLYLGVSPCKSLDDRDIDLVKSKHQVLAKDHIMRTPNTKKKQSASDLSHDVDPVELEKLRNELERGVIRPYGGIGRTGFMENQFSKYSKGLGHTSDDSEKVSPPQKSISATKKFNRTNPIKTPDSSNRPALKISPDQKLSNGKGSGKKNQSKAGGSKAPIATFESPERKHKNKSSERLGNKISDTVGQNFKTPDSDDHSKSGNASRMSMDDIRMRFRPKAASNKDAQLPLKKKDKPFVTGSTKAHDYRELAQPEAAKTNKFKINEESFSNRDDSREKVSDNEKGSAGSQTNDQQKSLPEISKKPTTSKTPNGKKAPVPKPQVKVIFCGLSFFLGGSCRRAKPGCR
jgi:hypothetical protein